MSEEPLLPDWDHARKTCEIFAAEAWAGLLGAESKGLGSSAAPNTKTVRFFNGCIFLAAVGSPLLDAVILRNLAHEGFIIHIFGCFQPPPF